MKDSLVADMRSRLEAGYWPRTHCLLLIALSAAAAFLVSVAMLAMDVESMSARYGVAAAGGYLAFLLLIRAWVRWKQPRLVDDPWTDLIGIAGDVGMRPPMRAGKAAADAFAGGRTGRGGASGAWDAPRASLSTSQPPSGAGSAASGISLDLDADDLVWLLLAVAAALAGVTAIAYVIWVAPTLLAEVAVNAVVAGKVYRGMRKHESQHWTTNVLRHTAIPAVVIVISASVAGYALQRVAPEAQLIGDVWQHLSAPLSTPEHP